MNHLKRIVALSALLFIAAADAATVTTLAIPSQKMARLIPATLILPDAYQTADQRFPVLYLLHGAGGNDQGWNAQTRIAALADQYGIIVLCPDGGVTSWYFDSPIDPTYQYETFVAKECVEYLDTHYRTQADRGHRALCGLSMGGHGAMYLAIRHRDTFSMAVPISGGVDIRPFPDHWRIKDRLGSITTHRENWEKNSVINLAKELKNGELALSIDCGTSDFFLTVNRALHNQLTLAGIQHTYIEKPGAHNWLYWREAIKRQMPLISAHFNQQK
jgi:S-formylglutathione hydrolase FrmB